MDKRVRHIVIVGEAGRWPEVAVEAALLHHYPAYTADCTRRTRISVAVESVGEIDDFVFEYQELFDNSFWRTVDLSTSRPEIETRRPQYHGNRHDFVDVEWEFVVCRISNPMLQAKLRRWSADTSQSLSIILCYDDDTNRRYEEKIRRRLPGNVDIRAYDNNPQEAARRMDEWMGLARYLHYFYQASYESRHVPVELPEAEVEKAWSEIKDSRLKMSNLYNVMSIPVKMRILGHDRDDWDKLYALTADEIELLTAVEHNRWSVERLIQGTRPCTDSERREIEQDMQRRLSDPEYAAANPVSLKKRYKTERNAHYDLCAFSELGVDETGLPVTRYDRDLTAAIPLIVKTFNDRRNNG